MLVTRRAVLASTAAALLVRGQARADSVTDDSGRAVPVPDKVTRVFPAGPPAAILLYTLAPNCCSAGRAPTGRKNAPTCCPTFARGRKSAASPDAATPPIWRR